MDYVGDTFTWSNKQDTESQINERLDRFLANEAFIQTFPHGTVKHLNWAQSDHRPIIFNVDPEFEEGSKRGRYRIFRFEEVWAHHSDRKALIANLDCWANTGIGNPRLELCLKKCKSRLQHWGKTRFLLSVDGLNPIRGFYRICIASHRHGISMKLRK